MALGRRITALGRGLESLASEGACLVRRQRAHLADHEAACPPFLVPVLHQIGGGTARLHSDSEALQRAVTSVPSEELLAAPIRAKCVHSALGYFRHRRFLSCFPSPV